MLKTEKILATAKQLVKLLFEKSSNSFQSEYRDRLGISPFLINFVCFLRTFHSPSPFHLHPFTTNPLQEKKSKKPIDIKRKYKVKIEGVHDNASAFMYLNIKTNS